MLPFPFSFFPPFPLFQNKNHHQNSAKTIENMYGFMFYYVLIAFNQCQVSGEFCSGKVFIQYISIKPQL